MVGNDIVDLEKANQESNWKHSRFIDKIFTANEKSIIENSNNPFQNIWRLWSMKESAYKAYVQHYRKPFFNPKKIECSYIDGIKGRATIEDAVYKTTTEITQNYIYTTALSSINIYSECFKALEENQSSESHKRLLKAFAEVYQLNFEELEIRKDTIGIPRLFYKEEPKKHSISITHHGLFVGIAFNKRD